MKVYLLPTVNLVEFIVYFIILDPTTLIFKSI